MEEEEDGGGDIPEWVVTFGDMMSLLLTFFIMLVSLSEMKEDEKYQAMLQSMQQRFGYSTSMDSMMPGSAKAGNAPAEKMATTGRASRKDTMNGGDKVKAPVGDHPRVQMIRQGKETGVGAIVFFEHGTDILTDGAKASLAQLTPEIAGKPQHIDIRGHVSRRPLARDSKFATPWDLAYARAMKVMRYMIDVQNIDPNRIRLSVAGPNEPLNILSDPKGNLSNDRVEAYLLDSIVTDTQGDPTQREQRYAE